MLKELPPPPQDTTGWPWTEESPQLPDNMPDGTPWPKISIVTPSLNQGQFIEETIRSVLLQGYPNLEYIIIDGGSKDGSVEIIEKYNKWLSYWVSEPDQGQPQAINKGFKKATGEIVAWINSDDYYAKEALKKVVNVFQTSSEVDMIYGEMLNIYEDGRLPVYIKASEYSKEFQIRSKIISQPTCFWRHTIFDKIGYLDESYQYIFDVDFWIRAGFHTTIKGFPLLLASFRIHPAAKTQQNNRLSTHEGIRMYERLFLNPKLPPEILNLKGMVLGHWYERLAKKYLKERLYQQARKSFWKAIQPTPLRLQNITLLCYILDTIFHTKFGKTIQRISLSIKMRFNLHRGAFPGSIN